MPSHAVHTETRRDLIVSIVEDQTAAEKLPHHSDDVFLVERLAHHRVVHQSARTKPHLAILDVVTCRREQIVVAGVIVVHVSDQDVFYLGWIDADRRQSFARRPEEFAPAACAGGPIEAGIDDDGAAIGNHGPHKIVERHRAIVRIAADEILTRAPVVMRITYRVYLPDPVAHRLIWSLYQIEAPHRAVAGGGVSQLRPRP